MKASNFCCLFPSSEEVVVTEDDLKFTLIIDKIIVFASAMLWLIYMRTYSLKPLILIYRVIQNLSLKFREEVIFHKRKYLRKRYLHEQNGQVKCTQGNITNNSLFQRGEVQIHQKCSNLRTFTRTYDS